MPDGPESNVKKLEARPEAREGGAAPTPSAGSLLRRLVRHRFAIRIGVVGCVLAIAAFVAGREIYHRINYVYSYDSRIEADVITVSSRSSGWVTSLLVKEGSRIAVGQTLATIDARESHLRVAELQAQLAGIDAERDRLTAERRLAEKQTSSLYSSQLSQYETAKVAVSSLEPQLTLARRELARSRALFENKVVSRRQLDQAETAEQQIDRQHRMAVAELAAAKANLEKAEAEKARLDVIDTEIAKLIFRRSEVKARLDHQLLDLADRTIKSPVDGVVDKTFVKVAEYVTPGQRLALVHDPDKIWVEANIKETEIRDLKVGQRVEVSVDAYPGREFVGRVLIIGHAATNQFALLPTPNPSGNFTKITQRLPVRVAVEQQDGLLRPGMMVEINIDIRSRKP
jgi:membrane fusion protein (multidrug efflux system)